MAAVDARIQFEMDTTDAEGRQVMLHKTTGSTAARVRRSMRRVSSCGRCLNGREEPRRLDGKRETHLCTAVTPAAGAAAGYPL